jgi:hypothetical protein
MKSWKPDIPRRTNPEFELIRVHLRANKDQNVLVVSTHRVRTAQAGCLTQVREFG